MFAIIQASGRQVKVEPGATVAIDGTAGEPGQEIAFSEVLLVSPGTADIPGTPDEAGQGPGVVAGTPHVPGAKVLGVVEGPAKGPKIRVFHKKRRKGMKRTRGHRAQMTRVRITDIVL